jgi:hypothetical protein
MKRRNQIAIGLMVIAVVAATAHVFAASIVRGRLVRNGPYGQYPAAGVGVSVVALSSPLGRSAMSYSGADGMYYIPNVPGGQYKLEIWVSNPPWAYDIAVYDQQAYTDIAPIVVP